MTLSVISKLFARNRPINELLHDFSVINPENIASYEEKYGMRFSEALKATQRVEVITENSLRLIYATVILYQLSKILTTSFSLSGVLKTMALMFFWSFLFLGGLFFALIIYYISLMIITHIVKAVCVPKEAKFVDAMKDLKEKTLESQKNQERSLRIRKTMEAQSQLDSVISDIDAITDHYKAANHHPLVNSKILKNSVDTILDTLIMMCNAKASNKYMSLQERTLFIKNHRNFLHLLSNVIDDEELYQNIDRYQKLSDLLQSTEEGSELSQTIVKELADLIVKDDRVLFYNNICLDKFNIFAEKFERDVITPTN